MARTSVKTIRKATNDWHECFPQFVMWKPRWLIRRIGPTLQGIMLEASASPIYRPLCFVHPLFLDWDDSEPSLMFANQLDENGDDQPPSTVYYKDHADLYKAAAATLKRRSPLSLGEPPSVPNLIKFAQSRLLTCAKRDMINPVEVEFAVGVAGLNGQPQVAQAILEEVTPSLQRSVARGILDSAELDRLTKNSQKLNFLSKNMTKQIEAMGISDLTDQAGQA